MRELHHHTREVPKHDMALAFRQNEEGAHLKVNGYAWWVCSYRIGICIQVFSISFAKVNNIILNWWLTIYTQKSINSFPIAGSRCN